ncbi:DUF2218 domain-containing protein [Microvirga rosea]|uniref:DUF2218 domain-containing protein n=1 Tax=Microvirga rosea TaxID=2715425 RepID=UPI001D0A7805|nr:DUF2218 domain-containing protein [Microvirga rosea]MCB8821832.1 DUF2218 domain-containing protein [Microvirga rosea]
MIMSRSEVRTEHASKYLTQLSKHWSHRFPDLTYNAERADIPLPNGPCILEAGPDHLRITLSGASEEGISRMEQVVADHLLRFAFREPLEIVWTREG